MNDDKEENTGHKVPKTEDDAWYEALTSKASRLAADRMFRATAEELAESYVDQKSASIKKASENRNE
ncbi:hypothetical protein LP43_0091 [Methylophaga thiooxydans]|uniref:Uncharacterized protein n=2 Tax=Methylophaga thiooxydans TaxID=392484 RepID=C0N3D5_9GAMM|nr:hypothetical protein [Methylophaga thiooxydans]EEF80682.1 hypothetical protein MDMS009_621 [Methylophaga thiooxydans DMS010]KGM07675.1 hypothetical protein LP43_0091 [Methylophaga thiooxydans]